MATHAFTNSSCHSRPPPASAGKKKEERSKAARRSHSSISIHTLDFLHSIILHGGVHFLHGGALHAVGMRLVAEQPAALRRSCHAPRIEIFPSFALLKVSSWNTLCTLPVEHHREHVNVDHNTRMACTRAIRVKAARLPRTRPHRDQVFWCSRGQRKGETAICKSRKGPPALKDAQAYSKRIRHPSADTSIKLVIIVGPPCPKSPPSP